MIDWQTAIALMIVTGAAGALPFGGLGASGNHRPAGFFAIDFCCDPIASLEQSVPVTVDPWGVAK